MLEPQHVQLLLVAGGVAGPRDARANAVDDCGRPANALEEKDERVEVEAEGSGTQVPSAARARERRDIRAAR